MNRVDAVIALKDAAIKVYGVLAVETDPGMQGGIATFDEATSHVLVTQALTDAHSAIMRACAAINHLS